MKDYERQYDLLVQEFKQGLISEHDFHRYVRELEREEFDTMQAEQERAESEFAEQWGYR